MSSEACGEEGNRSLEFNQFSKGIKRSAVWERSSPFNVVVVTEVVSLLLLLHVVQNHHRGVEVNDLSRGQQVEVGAAVTATVPVPGSGLSQGTVQASAVRGSEEPKLPFLPH